MSTLKGVIAKFRSDLLTKGEIALDKPEVITGGRCLLRLVMGFILSGATIFGGYSPFGVAVVGMSGAGTEGLTALIGTSLGYLLNLGFIGGLKYISASVLVFAAAYVFRDVKICEKSWFMPVIASFMSACTGFVYAADGGWSIAVTVYFFTEIILVGGCTYFYKTAITSRIRDAADEVEERKIAVSLLLLLATCLISINSIEILDSISVGRLIAQLIVIVIAFKTSMGIGCASGVAMGLAMDTCSGLGVPFYSMAYGFSGLLASVFNNSGRFLFTLAFILANSVSVLWTWGSVLQVSILYETFIVSVIFMILPVSLIGKVKFGTESSGYYGAVKVREYSKERVERLSDAFKSLYITVSKKEEEQKNDNNIATVFDRAADKCCRKCPLKTKCWNIKYETTLDAFNNATQAMLQRGKIRISDLPEHFAQSCLKIEDLIAAINDELKGVFYRKQFEKRIEESQAAAFEQYSDMSEILKTVANEMSTELTFVPHAEKKLTRYLSTLDIDAYTAVYRDRNGRLHAQIKGGEVRFLKSDREYLDKLSAILEIRLCEKRCKDTDELLFLQAEPLAAIVGIASVKKKGELVSGDKGVYFKTDDGVMYVILSDGMGSGRGAARESENTVNVLERFLRAGMDPQQALKILNSAITVRNELDTGFATVDLLAINLFTGISRIFKCGAAPSYVKKGKIVKKIGCNNIPAGILDKNSAAPDEINIKLEPGHFAVIASDGVSIEGDDEWLQETVSEYRGVDPKEFSRILLQKAVERYGCDDDMTVLVVFLEERQ